MNDKYRVKNGFNRKTCLDGEHTAVNDKCCGTYPKRVPYDEDRFDCCPDGVLRQPGSC